MLHVLGCITQQHDLRLVVLAAALCLLASATAMSMIARGRAAQGTIRTIWLVVGGIVAGCGIWALHFVAMLGYQAGLPVAYDLPRTVLSALVAALLCGVGFRVALTKAGPIVGGVIAGVAISAMHYIGMAALEMPARLIFDFRYVAASWILGIVASAVALQIALKRDDLRGYAIGAAIFLFAIVGMHFTGMSAATFLPDPTVPFSGVSMEPGILAIAVAAVAALIMALGLIGAIIDHQLAARSSTEAARLRAHVVLLEETKRQLEATSAELASALSVADGASRAKSHFLASMSHELRTPLNAVIGFSEVLATESFGPIGNSRYREYAQDIQSSGEHLLALINDILDLSRLDAGKADLSEEDIVVGDLIAEVLRMVSGLAEKSKLILRAMIAPNMPGLRADKRRMRQVLINLLSNACKFTPPDGEVSIDVRLVNGEFAITVMDTGIGIAEADIEKVFEIFRQVDSRLARQHGGSGLGLPLTKRLVDLHDGRIVLKSVPGDGTTVTIFMPAERVVTVAMKDVA
jgi:signal transduction histidine kinase